VINGAMHAFETPPIRLPYTTMITTNEAERLFDTEISEISFNATDAGAVIIREHTFVPLRPLAESLGYSIEWIEAERTVVLESNVA